MSENGNPVSDFKILDERQSFWQKARKTQTTQIVLVLIVISAIIQINKTKLITFHAIKFI